MNGDLQLSEERNFFSSNEKPKSKAKKYDHSSSNKKRENESYGKLSE